MGKRRPRFVRTLAEVEHGVPELLGRHDADAGRVERPERLDERRLVALVLRRLRDDPQVVLQVERLCVCNQRTRSCLFTPRRFLCLLLPTFTKAASVRFSSTSWCRNFCKPISAHVWPSAYMVRYFVSFPSDRLSQPAWLFVSGQ